MERAPALMAPQIANHFIVHPSIVLLLHYDDDTLLRPGAKLATGSNDWSVG